MKLTMRSFHTKDAFDIEINRSKIDLDA